MKFFNNLTRSVTLIQHLMVIAGLLTDLLLAETLSDCPSASRYFTFGRQLTVAWEQSKEPMHLCLQERRAVSEGRQTSALHLWVLQPEKWDSQDWGDFM